MKLNAANGKGVGKKGNSVFSINHGVQIEREYNGNVNNPQTPAQVGQRARFKLISQVSAAVEPVLVFRRKGLLSPRNIFTRRNMGFVYADAEGAQVTYENLQIAPGNNGLPGIRLSITEGIEQDDLWYELVAPVGADVSRVVFSFFVKGSENRLQFVTSRILETPNPYLMYMASMPLSNIPGDEDIICLAYGMRDRNKAASSKYYSYQIMSGEDIARLVATRKLDENNYTFTQTRGTTLFRGESSSATPIQGEAMLYITCLTGGQVSVVVDTGSPVVIENGSISVAFGKQVTLTPQHPEHYGSGEWVFNGWFNNGSQFAFSRDNPLTFTMNGMRDIVADWIWRQWGEGLE